MLTNWLKIFFRNFKKHPLYPTVNLLGLTAGITCFLLAMLYVSHEFSYETWNPKAEQLYRPIILLEDGQVFVGSPGPMPAAVTETYPEIIDWVVSTYSGTPLVSHGEKTIYANEITATDNWFEFFPYPFIHGDANSCLKDENSIVINQEVAQSIFGDENPIGKTVKLHNQDAFEVTGVFSNEGINSYYNDVGVVLKGDREDFMNDSWGNFNYEAYYLTTPDFDLEKLNSELTDFYLERGAKAANTTKEDYAEGYRATLEIESFADIHLYSKTQKGKGTNTIFVLSLLSLLILLISAINFVNLSISGATQRAKEVAVRKTLGSARGSIVTQFVAEVGVLCLIALLVSLALTEIMLPAFSNLLNAEMEITGVLADLPLLFGVILSVLLIAGLFPALYLANFDPVKVLKGNFGRSKSGTVLKKGMIIFQFAASAIFLVGAYIVNEQLNYMENKDLGFDKEQTILIATADGEKVIEKQDLYRNELSKVSGVETTLITDRPPGKYNRRGSVSQVFYGETMYASDLHFVDENFFPGMKIPILQGRNLDKNMVFDSIDNKVLVNETFVKLYQMEEPIGKKIRFWGNYDSEIIGVVKDYITKGFDYEITPAVYNMPYSANFVLVRMQSSDLEGTIAGIEKAWTEKVEPGFPFRYEFLDENFAELYEQQTKLRTLISGLSAVMVLIALLGLFAVATHTIQQRYKEVAIRKTLGASEIELYTGLIKDFVIICLIAVLIALPIAYSLVTTWLESFTYRIDMPMLPYLAVPVLVTILTVLMVWTQAGRAMKVDLVKYLKYE